MKWSKHCYQVAEAGADLPENEPIEVIKPEEPHEEGPAEEPDVEEGEESLPEDKYEEKPEQFSEDTEEGKTVGTIGDSGYRFGSRRWLKTYTVKFLGFD